MSGFLYINSKGDKKYRHSYSAGITYDKSPYAYYLQKILGWRPRDDKAAFRFGRALEESIQYHHDNNGDGAVQDFIQRWTASKEDTYLKYTKVEGNWESLLKSGTEMVKLYVLRQPSLPIPLGGQSVWQREYTKEVFPGDETYGGIEFFGKLDIVTYVDPNHPLLPKMTWRNEWGPLRPSIIDIKTSGDDFPERPGLAAFDKQLRTYSWLTGIPTAGFLWFKKCGHRLQKGVSVTLLEKAGEFAAGDEAVVVKVDGDHAWLLGNDYWIDEMEKAQGLKEDGSVIQTNAAKAKGMEWLKEHGVLASTSLLTRQRLQFNVGLVSNKSAQEAGQLAASQIVRIVNSWNNKSWPSNFGVRYPNNDINDPYFRAFVLDEKAFRDENFTKSDQEELDDIFDDSEGGAA